MEWLQLYNLVEAHDIQLLDNPQKHIIDPGGCIYLAAEGNEIVGCAGLMIVCNGEYELVKMSVAPAYRGRGISKFLLDHCISHAKKLNAAKITLFSNHQLEKAIRLYQQYGFVNVPVTILRLKRLM